MYTADPSEHHLEFFEHRTSDFYRVFTGRYAINENHYLKRPAKVRLK